MILPGTRKVKLADILVPKGFRERKKAAHIPSRMESIKRHGLINLIVIQDRTKKLLAGGDRLTALLALKVKTHEARVFRGTEEEFKAMQLAENIERRHDDDIDAMTKQYVELTQGEIEKAEAAEPTPAVREAILAAVDNARKFGGTPDVIVHDGVEYRTDAVTEPEEPRPVGRPKTSKGKAREAVAAATGKTPEAIRQAEKRARAKEKAAEEPEAPAADMGTPTLPLPPPVETYGLPLLNDDEAYQVLTAQDALKKVEGLLRKAHGVLMNEVEPNSLAAVICKDVLATLYEFTQDVRQAIPVAVCAHCKRLPGREARCGECCRTGFIGAEEALGLADELRLGGDKAVVSDGKGGFVPYSREVAKEEKKAKKLRIEMPDGSTLEGGE